MLTKTPRMSRLRVVDEERVADPVRIEPLGGQLALLLLEGLGEGEVVHQSDEQRPGVGRQGLGQARAQDGQVEAGTGDDGGHAGAALGAGDLDAVDRRGGHAGRR